MFENRLARYDEIIGMKKQFSIEYVGELEHLLENLETNCKKIEKRCNREDLKKSLLESIQQELTEDTSPQAKKIAISMAKRMYQKQLNNDGLEEKKSEDLINDYEQIGDRFIINDEDNIDELLVTVSQNHHDLTEQWSDLIAQCTRIKDAILDAKRQHAEKEGKLEKFWHEFKEVYDARNRACAQLRTACLSGQLRLVKQIVSKQRFWQRKSYINRVDGEGRNILHYLAMLPNNNSAPDYVHNITESFEAVGVSLIPEATQAHHRIFKYLLGKGAYPGNTDLDKYTALHLCAKSGNFEIAEYLTEHRNTDINATGYLNRTPLHIAAHNGKTSIVKLLLEHNANTELKEEGSDFTPLHEACSRNHRESVELLLAHGANANAITAKGQRPINIAVGVDYHIVQLLLRYRAEFDDQLDASNSIETLINEVRIMALKYRGSHDDLNNILMTLVMEVLMRNQELNHLLSHEEDSLVPSPLIFIDNLLFLHAQVNRQPSRRAVSVESIAKYQDYIYHYCQAQSDNILEMFYQRLISDEIQNLISALGFLKVYFEESHYPAAMIKNYFAFENDFASLPEREREEISQGCGKAVASIYEFIIQSRGAFLTSFRDRHLPCECPDDKVIDDYKQVDEVTRACVDMVVFRLLSYDNIKHKLQQAEAADMSTDEIRSLLSRSNQGLFAHTRDFSSDSDEHDHKHNSLDEFVDVTEESKGATLSN